jgi:CIC family chloride channel protein
VETLVFLRGEIRASELWLVVVAAAVGAAAGLSTIAIGLAAHGLQQFFYNIDFDERLSAAASIAPERLIALPIGGAILVIATWLWVRGKRGTPVDPVEANALRGGRMSIRDSLYVAFQTIASNGMGASVGLEAAYAQIGGAAASFAGRMFNLRRSDMRTFVGAGAGAAIGAAFGAPWTGAFYAFEIIIGSYTIANAAPVVVACLAAVLITNLAHFQTMVIHIKDAPSLSFAHYLLFSGLGLVCAACGIGVMRLVGWTEMVTGRIAQVRSLRPILGGVLLAGLAFIQPQTLSAGHGAMHLDITANLGVQALLFLLVTKVLASGISLGFGFRGGLFFASLYMGSLIGRLYAVLLGQYTDISLDPLAASLVGMGAMAVAVVGGPFTMSFLVLETTGDFGLTAATLTASIVASVIVRETFGYSFSTWRLHLRGETIRSAHDVGWLRTLTAGRMMRTDPPSIGATASLEEFRRRFPLGSARRVIALDETKRYVGIVPTSAVYGDQGELQRSVSELMVQKDQWLSPDMAIKEIMSVFDRSESDELAVLGADQTVLGVLTEAYATRRYAEELEKNRRDLIGGD